MAESLSIALRRLGVAVPDRRFAVAFAAVGLIACASFGLWRIGMSSHAGASTEPFSEWAPHATGFRAAQEIAEQVAASNIGVRRVPIAVPVPWHGGRAKGDSDAGKRLFSALAVHERGGPMRIYGRDTIAFSLCGPGGSCTLALETQNQRLLAQREGLELALYSFTYLGIERLLVLMPPSPGDDHPLRALLFQRSQLAPLLRRPLQDTLNRTLPTEAQLDGDIGRRLRELTAAYLYAVETIPSPNGGAPVLALSPVEER